MAQRFKCDMCGADQETLTCTYCVAKMCQGCLRHHEPDCQQRHRARRKRMAVAYKGGKCQRCGYCRCIHALEVHHLERSTKDRSLLNDHGSIDFCIAWAKLKVELDKCILLCANCHREVEYPSHVA